MSLAWLRLGSICYRPVPWACMPSSCYSRLLPHAGACAVELPWLLAAIAWFFVVAAGHDGSLHDGWLMAFVLALADAVSMTYRLLRMERSRTRQ